SMAGLSARLFVARNRHRVNGVILVDATTPEVMDSRLVAGFIENFARVSRVAAWSADNGLLKPLTRTGIADPIGLSGAAKAEKRWAFASASHNHWAAQEVASWAATAEEALTAGPFDRSLPVAVVLAGAKSERARWKTHLTEPAVRSASGLVEYVRGASHANILGPRHAAAVVSAIGAVRAFAARAAAA
ncbi:MAG: alpha/beta hydrolase, partial [Candidatus Dormibacteria bacterium]